MMWLKIMRRSILTCMKNEYWYYVKNPSKLTIFFTLTLSQLEQIIISK